MLSTVFQDPPSLQCYSWPFAKFAYQHVRPWDKISAVPERSPAYVPNFWLVTLVYWSFPKPKVKTCTVNSNVGQITSIHQFLEERLPIKKCHNKTSIKWCKNISQIHYFRLIQKVYSILEKHASWQLMPWFFMLNSV